ncbi:hypothetical protein DBR43_17525 [Pedobacter sp. KBW06]|uniref:outer membrane beta-barrel family protein n=1 Tax=Pedobacter sp. KBW06 TaxID=2153359 RepID=UPI000F5B7A01|nr:outer membrane beta-barrel family protein [Pedobacter sp. KBW06]RQO69854.1 hypothetical protein DBR43_17525 [Pedobacter sp. KBW06]
MKTLFLLFIACIAFTRLTQAQERPEVHIKGSLRDMQKQPVIYSTLSLIDSTGKAINFAISDEQGIYHFRAKLKAGTYKISASSMGYAAGIKAFDLGAEVKELQIPELVLVADTRTLAEVTIKSKKPLIEQKIDRLVFNVSQSPMAASSSALDLLRRAPGVNVDQSDAIKLRGKNVLVMVDNKRTYLSGDQVAQYLKSMQGDQIEKMEIISNPSAKYDAEGVGGIINIVSKKDKKMGVNGAVTAGGGYGKNGKYNGNTVLNVRESKFAISGTLGFNHDKSPTSGELNRVLENTTFAQSSSSLKTLNSGLGKLSFDFFLDKKNTFGLGFIANQAENDLSNTSLTFLNQNQNSNQLNLFSSSLSKWNSQTYSFNYKSQLKEEESISLDADLSRYNNNGNINYISQNINSATPDDKTFNNNRIGINIASVKLDYEKALFKKLGLEAGLKYSRVSTNNLTKFDQLIDGNRVDDVKRSNVFRYDENIYAGYLNFNARLNDKLSLQFGLRGEKTISDGNSKTLDSAFRLDYFKLFPSLYGTYSFNKNHQVGASYSRRIGRPGYKDLNPFIYYVDQYTANQGNPYLRPSFTNSFELNYTFFRQYNISVGYQQTNDEFEKVAIQEADTKLVKEMYQNFDKFYGYFISANIPVTVAKFWEINNAANLYYTDYTLGQIRSRGSALQLNSTSTFSIPGNYTAEMDMIYFYNNAYGIYRVKPNLYFNIGVAKTLNDKRSSLKLSVFDVFNSNRSNVVANLGSLNLDSRYRWEGTRVNLSFNYKFGKNTVKGAATKRKSSAEEQSRIKN